VIFFENIGFYCRITVRHQSRKEKRVFNTIRFIKIYSNLRSLWKSATNEWFQSAWINRYTIFNFLVVVNYMNNSMLFPIILVHRIRCVPTVQKHQQKRWGLQRFEKWKARSDRLSPRIELISTWILYFVGVLCRYPLDPMLLELFYLRSSARARQLVDRRQQRIYRKQSSWGEFVKKTCSMLFICTENCAIECESSWKKPTCITSPRNKNRYSLGLM
jgi:hypothetical protein